MALATVPVFRRDGRRSARRRKTSCVPVSCAQQWSNYFYTDDFDATPELFDPAANAAALWFYSNSPVRGGLFTLSVQSAANIPGKITAGIAGNVWGGWTADDGAYGGAEFSPLAIARGNVQGLGGFGGQQSTAGRLLYGFGGVSWDGAYAQFGKKGYLEIGLGLDFLGHGNISAGLLIDYRKLTTPWWSAK
jgi:hypothetical protein